MKLNYNKRSAVIPRTILVTGYTSNMSKAGGENKKSNTNQSSVLSIAELTPTGGSDNDDDYDVDTFCLDSFCKEDMISTFHVEDDNDNDNEDSEDNEDVDEDKEDNEDSILSGEDIDYDSESESESENKSDDDRYMMGCIDDDDDDDSHNIYSIDKDCTDEMQEYDIMNWKLCNEQRFWWILILTLHISLFVYYQKHGFV